MSEYVIPSDRTYPWEANVNVGVIGGIPDTSGWTFVNAVTEGGADNTGATDTQPEIQALVDAAVGNTVIYLPAGTYRFDSAVALLYKDNIVIRGAGNSTVIDWRGSGPALAMGGDADYLWSYPLAPITGSPAAGTSVLTTDTTGYTGAEGALVQISLDDDLTIPVIHVSSFRRNRKFKAQIVSMTETTLTIRPPIPFDLDESLNPKIAVATFSCQNSGIEDLHVDCANASTESIVYGVAGGQLVNCWFKGVEVSQVKNYNFGLGDSAFCEIRECYANERTAAGIESGSNGGGILLSNAAWILIEDNILRKNFPLIEMNGVTGTVFAYNFLNEVGVPGAGNGAAIDTNHGPHSSFNLIEGNVSPNLQCDGYFGSASDDTLFRNWFHGINNTGSYGNSILLQRFTRRYNIVGNVFQTYEGPDYFYSFGYPNMGNSDYTGTAQLSEDDPWADWAAWLAASPGAGPGANGFQELDLDVEATVLIKANRKLGTINDIDPSESILPDTLRVSLFRSSEPSFFFGFSWPPVDSSTSKTETTIEEIAVQIPAGFRYFNGAPPEPGSGTLDCTTLNVTTFTLG